MTITQRVARKSLTHVEYEMDYFTVEMSSEDMAKELRDKLTPSQQATALQVMIQKQTIIDLVMAGHMPMEAARNQLAHLDECLKVFSTQPDSK